MKLKDQDAGLMIVTIMKALDKLDELDSQVKTIYFKMITLLFNHFNYSIKDLQSIEVFTGCREIIYRTSTTRSISRSRFYA